MVRDLAFRIAAFFLVGDGVAALYLAGLLDNLGALLVVAALALAWIVNLSRLSAGGLPMLARILILVVAGAVTLDLVYIAPSLLDGFVYLLLLLVLLRLFTARSSGDLRDAGLISFFMLVASAAMTFDISQLVVFIVYLILVTWLLMLHHFMSESARTSEGARPTPRVGLDVVRVALAAPVAVLFVTASLFFIIPRVGQASLPGRTELRRMVTGFTSEVELGAIGEIESDSTVVMRVYLPNGMLGAIELRFEDRNPDAWRFLAIAYGRSNNMGMMALALAEEGIANGDYGQARQQAARAIKQLPAGPAKQRAQDIQDEAKREGKP